MNLLLISVIFALTGQDSSATKKQFNNTAIFDLVITEVMADPDPPVGLPDQEFCEIYNRSASTINLAGWTFFDGSSRILPSVYIAPGEYVIICDDGDTALFSGYGKFAAITSISLTNTGEKIALRDPMGNPVDSVTYSDGWFGNSVKKDGGWSLEKVDVDFTCPVSSNWLPSANVSGGTPGAANSVAGTILDNEQPLLLRSYCTDSISIVLVFNEPLDPNEALSILHFNFSSSLNPVEAVFEDEFLQRVKLTLATALVPGQIYTVSVSGVTDCAGNEVPDESTSRFGIIDSVSGPGIIINELLFNPYTDGYDFIELFHAGNNIIDLSNVKIVSVDLENSQIDESEKIIEEPWLIFPGDYLVITENPTAVASHYRSSYPFNFLEIGNLPSMNVDEGHIAISVNEQIIDAIHYFDDYHFELLEDFKGISLEKINPLFNSSNSASWHSAAGTDGFATPGLKNSQYAEVMPGDKEVMLSPELFTPDNDGIDDVVTIVLKMGTPGYISNTWVYNSSGQIVFKNATNSLLASEDSFVWDGITDSGVKAPAGIYVALVEVFHLEGEVKKYRLPFVLAVKL